MSLFLGTPWFLAGLAAAAVPLLMLLTKAAARERILFSSVYFLKQVTRAASRRLEWKRLLLLAARVTALALLALGFAKPYLFFNRSSGSAARSAHSVFILDGSAGMNYRSEGGTSFEKARQKIRDEVRKAGQGTFSLFLFDTAVRPFALQEKSAERFLRQLDSAAPADAAGDWKALEQWLPSVCPAGDPKTHCFLASDFLVSKAVLRRLTRSAALRLLPVRPPHFDNFYLGAWRLPPRPLLAGREEILKASYGSTGSLRPVRLSLWVNGKEVQHVQIDLKQSPEGTVVFKQRFDATGPARLRLEASSGDGLGADDSSEQTVWVSNPVRMLLVTEEEAQRPFESPDFYLTQALLSAEEGPEDSGWAQFVRKTPPALDAEALDSYDFIFLTEVFSLSPRALTALRYYLKAGGTVFFFPAGGPAPALYAKSPHWTQFLGGRFADEITAGDRPLKLEETPYGHPLFKVFEGGRRGSFESLALHRLAPYLPDAAPDLQVLLWTSGRRPVLTERKIGSGRLFIASLGLTPSWSSLPQDPLFVPWILELMRYASRSGSLQSDYGQAGDPLIIAAEETRGLKRLEIRAPGNIPTILYPVKGGGFVLEDTRRAGRYEWQSGERLFQKILAVPASESRPQGLRISLPETSGAAAARDSRSQNGPHTPHKNFFYKACFYTVLAALLLEMLIAGRLDRPGWV